MCIKIKDNCCPHCGFESLPEESLFCPNCGQRMGKEEPAVTSEQQNVTTKYDRQRATVASSLPPRFAAAD